MSLKRHVAEHSLQLGFTGLRELHEEQGLASKI